MIFFKGGYLRESVRDIFTMHDCVILLSIYREKKIVARISQSGKLVEYQGGAPQKSQTATPSALFMELTHLQSF